MPARIQLYINSAEHQLQLAQRKHIWCSCISTAIASLNRSRFRQHSRVDHSGIPTAISCKKLSITDVCHQRGIALRQQESKRSRSGRHGRVEHSGISTAISKKKTYLAQIHVTSVV